MSFTDPMDSLVRIVDADGSTKGTGFFAGPAGRIVTCAHVVEDAGGKPGSTVDFVCHKTGERRSAMVLGEPHWSPLDAADVAVLELIPNDGEAQGTLPADMQAAALASSTIASESLRSYGFPAVNPEGGLAARLTVIGWAQVGESRLLEVRAPELSYGFSGAPVWDDGPRYVIGIVDSFVPVGADPGGKQRDTAFVRPMEAVRTIAGLELDPECPYRGLDPFEPKHVQDYFGRDAAIAELLAKLSNNDVTAVIGISGSGKSSLVSAGLAKGLAITKIPGLAGCHVCAFKPGVKPIMSLLSALTQIHGQSEQEIYEAFGLKTEDEKDHGKSPEEKAGETLAEALSEKLRLFLGKLRVILVADQFERLFTDCPDEETRRKFIDVLLGAATDRIKLLTAFRADFYGAALGYAPFANSIRYSQMTLLPMSDEELREAIVEPARLHGRHVDPELADCLVRDVSGRAGDLPLLQIALTYLWEKDAATGVLTLNTYNQLQTETPEGKAIRGAKAAIVLRAQKVWDDIADKDRPAAQGVFLSLVRVSLPGAGNPVVAETGRRAILSEFSPHTRKVAQRLAGSFLLTAGRDPFSGEASIEVAHEAVIAHWPLLRRWLEKYRPFIAWYTLQFTTYLEPWLRERDRKKKKSYLLPKAVLGEAKSWQTRYPDFLKGPPAELIEASAEKYLRQNILMGVAAGILVAAILYGSLLSNNARVANAQALHEQGVRALLDNDFQTAQLLLAESLASQNSEEVRLELVQARIAAATAVKTTAPDGEVVEANTDGSYLTFKGKSGTIGIWNRSAGQATQTPFPLLNKGDSGEEEELDVRSAINPDGTLLAYGDGSGTVRLWDIPGRRELTGWTLQRIATAKGCSCQGQAGAGDSAPKPGDPIGIDSLTFAPDNRTLAIGTFEGTIELWDTTNRQRTKEYCGHDRAVHTVAFTADQHWLASGGADRTVRIWGEKSACAVHKLEGHEDFVSAVAFSPDGRHLASGSADTTVRIWETGQGKQVDSFSGYAGTVTSLAYSGDGQLLLTGSEDRTARLWQEAIGKELLRLPAPERVNAVAFDAERHLVVAGRGAGTDVPKSGAVESWDFGGKQEGFTLRNDGSVFSVAFDPQGRRLASGGRSSQIEIWNMPDPKQPLAVSQAPALRLPAQGNGSVWSLAFAPDGTLASAGEDHIVRLWEIPYHTSTPLPAQNDQIWSVAFHPKRPLLASAADHTISLWDTHTHQLVDSIEHKEGTVWTVSFSPNGDLLASGGGDSSLRLWDITGPKAVKKGKKKLADELWGVPFEPNGGRIASAGLDRAVHLFTVPGLESVKVFDDSQQHDGLVQSAAFSPDGKWVATASADHTVRLWDVHSGRTVNLVSHAGPVWWVTFSADGQWLASAGLDHTIQVRNLKVIESILTETPSKLLEQAEREAGLRYLNGKVVATGRR